MLVNNFVVSRLCIDIFRGIEVLGFEALLYLPVRKVTAPDFDDNAPLAVEFLGDRVIISVYIVIFVERQSARVCLLERRYETDFSAPNESPPSIY